MALQPTIYWKNAAQQGLPFTADPRVLYRGLGAALVTGAQSSKLELGCQKCG